MDKTPNAQAKRKTATPAASTHEDYEFLASVWNKFSHSVDDVRRATLDLAQSSSAERH